MRLPFIKKLIPTDNPIQIGSCEEVNNKVINVNQSMKLPPNCQLNDTRFVIQDRQGISLDLNGATLVSTGFESAIFVTSTSQGRNPSKDILIKNGSINGYGTSIYVHRELSQYDIDQLRTSPETYYPEIQQTASSSITFDNIHTNNTKGSGLYVWVGNQNVRFQNGSIKNARGPGIYLDTGSSGNIIENNLIEGCGYLQSDGSARTGRGRREGIAIDGSYNNQILNNVIKNNSRGGVHLYSNCGEHVSTDATYVPRIFDAKNNLIKSNTIMDNGDSGCVEIGKRVDWNLETWDCAKPIYSQFFTYKYYFDNSGINIVEDNIGNGTIIVRTDSNVIQNNEQVVEIGSTVRDFEGEPVINNININNGN